MRHLDGHRFQEPVLLDMTGLTFVDVAGLRAILAVRDRLLAEAPEVQFSELPGTLTRILEILSIDLYRPPGE